MPKISCRAYAKIDLSRNVLGSLPNGTLQMEAVSQLVGIYDEVRVQDVEKQEGEPFLSLTNSGCEELSKEASALIFTAAKSIVEMIPLPADTALEIHVEKKFPSAACLSDTASNAAAVMLLMSLLYEAADISLENLLDIGAKLDSNIPFFLAANAFANDMEHFAKHEIAACTFLTDDVSLTRLAPPGGYAILCVTPGKYTPTAIYEEFQNGDYYGKMSDMEVLKELLDSAIVPVSSSEEKLHAAMSVQFGGLMGSIMARSFGVAKRYGKSFTDNLRNSLQPAAIQKYPLLDSMVKLVDETVKPDAILMVGTGPTIAAYYLPKRIKEAQDDLKFLKEMLSPRGVFVTGCPLL
ncbi:MAG: hypothetical protein LBU41_02025 [Clostridiales Family XIII bacterium]|jgi:4-diphosphocytidyl-2C-methyl-D-erythritol kinase|nr:hypothetical protein [Clostridiales Family XIII bacterium]